MDICRIASLLLLNSDFLQNYLLLIGKEISVEIWTKYFNVTQACTNKCTQLHLHYKWNILSSENEVNQT